MTPRSARAADRAPVLDEVLQHRIVVVGGKGGTGKSSVAGALCLTAARRGKRVLGIEVDAKGDLAAALGSKPVGFDPKVVAPNISVLALHVEESLQEYLNVFFKVPKLTRLTPLARVFEFIASGVPGPKDMLVIGKIAYEERRRDRGGEPVWDLIVVDASASGHLVGQLSAPRSMHRLMQGGIIRQQTEWIEDSVTDARRTVLCICSLPEEMPVVEALELQQRATDEAGIHVGAFFLNRAFPVAVGPRVPELAAALVDDGVRTDVERRLHGRVEPLHAAAVLARRLSERTDECAKRLQKEAGIPVVALPLLEETRSAAAVARGIATALDSAAAVH